ncbi:MAG: ABC transporter permease [Desulfotomaculum sp.]|nr:ABC transporter permease [Desulfotomaculum sp.]
MTADISLINHLIEISPELWKATYQTLVMVGATMFFSTIIGVPLGVLLVVTEKGSIMENPKVCSILGSLVNIFRSVPFIILLIALFPLTRLIVGTTVGTAAATVPLVVGAAPFVARIVESSLKEVDKGVVEAAISMGARPWQIITKVLLPEALPGIILGLTITTVTVISYSAMAGVVGGGGLGDLAYRYGFQRFDEITTYAVVVILVIMVQLVQSFGSWLSKAVNKK